MFEGFAKKIDGTWRRVTLRGQVFACSKSLMVELLDTMRKKHPTVEFKMEPADWTWWT